MRAILLFAFVLILMCSPSALVHAQNDKEQEEIKAIILRETTSFMNLDHLGWMESWDHSPFAYWSFSDSSGSSVIEGWDKIDKTYASYFQSRIPSKSRITDEWKEIRVYGNGAYARFIQRATDNFETEETSQVRVLEKKDGKWKVVYVGVVAQYPKKKP